MAHAARLDDVEAADAKWPLVFLQFPDDDPRVNQGRYADFTARVVLRVRGDQAGKESGDALGFEHIDHACEH